MKTSCLVLFSALAFVGCAAAPAPRPVYGETNPGPGRGNGVKNYCSMVELRPEKEAEYRKLHADVWPEVQAAIRKAHIRNFNIYVVSLRGHRYLVSYFEYTGNNAAADFAGMAKDPTTRNRWWPLTDACQQVLEGTAKGQQWLPLEQVMHLD